VKQFQCSKCGEWAPVLTHGATGYARHGSKMVCYPCCAEIDREWMHKHGKIVLYWDTVHVTNWPGSLKFEVWGVRVSKHNIGGHRTDLWFLGPDGYVWHGVHIGVNHQIIRCKRTVRKSR
jgi:hypothetical protein